MLVLSRKVGERIVIGDDVVLTVVEVSGNRVRLGIEAPRSKQVLRVEIIESPMVTSHCNTDHRVKRGGREVVLSNHN